MREANAYRSSPFQTLLTPKPLKHMHRLHITAIAVAFFGGYVVPIAILFGMGEAGMFSATSGPNGSQLLSLVIISSYVLQPLIAGFLAARIAKQAPICNALAASLLGTVMYCLMRESIAFSEAGWWLAINAAGAIAGSMLSSRTAKRDGPTVP